MRATLTNVTSPARGLSPVGDVSGNDGDVSGNAGDVSGNAGDVSGTGHIR